MDVFLDVCPGRYNDVLCSILNCISLNFFHTHCTSVVFLQIIFISILSMSSVNAFVYYETKHLTLFSIVTGPLGVV